jgi:hypothetical protein
MLRILQRAYPVVLTGITLAITGCGSRESYDVSGVAEYQDGSPITGAVRIVRLEPAADTTAALRKVASGYLAEDGSFEMFTRRPGDGVVPGKYVVTFTVMDKAMGGKSLIPAKYNNAETSPFELVVDDDKEGLEYKLEKL